ncbi:YdcF family protein [Dyadobacter subterraneus]|uniref:YdcF family protein n=1 Tax=Dyadobacter subterraneus TaxID=2773304 RepID=A0ABR9W4B8_9BACT|nr:YdcF family protein [Dyadobacter subterraneus]MBE9460301.1 YdcF family protein [Dyadobacter subterraneus]
MFYFLSKTIDFLLMPFSISLILILYALMTKNARRKRIAVISSFAILYLISNSFLINKAFNWWEYKPFNISKVNKTYDVGILLTGGMISTPDLTIDHPNFGPHADRFLQAYLLYKNGKIKKILITGASPKDLVDAGKSEVQQVSSLLIQWGVKPEDILLEPKAKNTRENAVFTEEILRKKFPGKNYVLITSSFHLRRALACFKKVGVSTDVFPADFYGGAGSSKIKDMIIPDPEVVGYSQPLFREWVGIIIYKIMGYC